MTFYLASQSPRRRELLSQIGVEFTVVVPNVDETPQDGESAAAYVQRLALAKAEAGLALAKEEHAVVLGADTIVMVDDRILGKPADFNEAQAMLGQLSGRQHQVLSALALWSNSRHEVGLSTTLVSFRNITQADIEAYWRSGEPRDKAGAYGIQGLGAVFVTHIAGSYSGVVGLPIETLVPLLNEFGIAYWSANGSPTSASPT